MYLAAFVICAVLGAAKLLNNNVMRYMLQIFLYITLGEMWNLLSGFAGMTSLGQQLFMGLSGYTVAVVTTLCRQSYPLGMAAGAAVSLIAAALLGLLLLRMRGMYFAIATWVAAEAMGTFFFSWRFVNQGAGMNMSISPYPRVGKLYLIALGICVCALAAVQLLLGSKLGLGLTAMRDDMTAAASVGVNIGLHKFAVYLTAAVFTALAGSVFFINKGTIYPDSGFGIGWTISMVFIVIIGGAGTIEGPVVGAVIYVLLSEYLAHFPGWSNMILGALSIIMILFMPQGIVGTIKKAAKSVNAKKAEMKTS